MEFPYNEAEDVKRAQDEIYDNLLKRAVQRDNRSHNATRELHIALPNFKRVPLETDLLILAVNVKVCNTSIVLTCLTISRSVMKLE